MISALGQSGDDEHPNNEQYLVFPLAEDNYGLNITYIREIIEYNKLTEVPMVPDFIRGVLNLRGHVVPVIDLNCRFSGKISDIGKRSCILVVDSEQKDSFSEMGILVDSVTKMIEIDTKNIEPAPSFGSKIRTDFIHGMGRIDDDFIVLLQVHKVLSIDELSIIKNIHDDIDEAVKNESNPTTSDINDQSK